jgi:hypothetical protein
MTAIRCPLSWFICLFSQSRSLLFIMVWLGFASRLVDSFGAEDDCRRKLAKGRAAGVCGGQVELGYRRPPRCGGKTRWAQEFVDPATSVKIHQPPGQGMGIASLFLTWAPSHGLLVYVCTLIPTCTARNLQHMYTRCMAREPLQNRAPAVSRHSLGMECHLCSS